MMATHRGTETGGTEVQVGGWVGRQSDRCKRQTCTAGGWEEAAWRGAASRQPSERVWHPLYVRDGAGGHDGDVLADVGVLVVQRSVKALLLQLADHLKR